MRNQDTGSNCTEQKGIGLILFVLKVVPPEEHSREIH